MRLSKSRSVKGEGITIAVFSVSILEAGGSHLGEGPHPGTKGVGEEMLLPLMAT